MQYGKRLLRECKTVSAREGCRKDGAVDYFFTCINGHIQKDRFLRLFGSGRKSRRKIGNRRFWARFLLIWLQEPGNLVEISMKHPVDAHVGKRIRHRRWMVGMTQQQLADRVGIKFQQIQKYETGMNRVSASRLWDIAAALGVTIGFFFEGLASGGEAAGVVDGDFLADKEALDLVRSYYAIPEAQRRRLFELVRVLSEAA